MISPISSTRAGLALALAFFCGMLSSSLPTPLYPVYISLYGFSASQIMTVFGVYAAGVLLALAITIRVRIKPESYSLPIFAGLGCVLLSSLLMMFANNITLLILARFITGLGSGILMAYINRSLVKIFDTEVSNAAARTAAVSLILGQALGPLITGNIVQHDFYKLKAPYLILVVLTVISIVGIWRHRLTVNSAVPSAKMNEQYVPDVQSKSHLSFSDVIVCCMAIFLSWALASTFMSQGPTLAHRYFGITSVQWVSYSLSAFLLMAGLTQWVMRKTDHFASLKIGVTAQLSAVVLAFYSVHTVNSCLLFIAVLLEGFAYGAILVGAATIVNRVARQSQRAHLINLLYIVGYVGNWLPFSLSVMMDHLSLVSALNAYLLICLCLAFSVSVSAYLSGRDKKDAQLA